MVMIREWRHIKMLKRAGRGHDPSGVEGTTLGELTIRCRACPHPDINLPPRWQETPEKNRFVLGWEVIDLLTQPCRWLYSLIIAEDANFKQKSRLRSSDEKDPALGPGWATFVNSQVYQDHLATHGNQEEISHCVGFSALWDANSKHSKGLRATGIGSVTCARHECFLPNGMGDLQKGER
jgi:hypothetical protein